MTGEELLQQLGDRGALLHGHFLLSSGLHSDRFIQKFRIFEDPPTAEAVGAALAERLRPFHPQVVIAAAVGGIIPGYIVARHLGVRNIFVEKEGGVPALRRGFTLASRERVAIVEDVMTTGKSTTEVIGVVESAGAQIVAIGAIIKRGSPTFSYPLVTLLDLPLADYTAQDCPQCARDVPLQDPGSRRT